MRSPRLGSEAGEGGEPCAGGCGDERGAPALRAWGPQWGGALTRTCGLWSLAPAEASTSFPGPMTHRAAGQRGERQKSGRAVRMSLPGVGGDLPASMPQALPGGYRPTSERPRVRHRGSKRAILAPRPAGRNCGTPVRQTPEEVHLSAAVRCPEGPDYMLRGAGGGNGRGWRAGRPGMCWEEGSRVCKGQAV